MQSRFHICILPERRLGNQMTTKILCNNVMKSYGENIVLKNLDFWVDAGELVTIISPSGGGKTTLLNILGGLTTPDNGAVMVAGQDLSRLDEDGRAALRRQSIGIVHQSSYLFPWLSVKENLEVGPTPRAPASWLTEVKRNLGVDDFQNTEINKLSGGQRRRVCILRALQMEAEVLLLDEPTTGLDDHLAFCVRRALRDLADRGSAVVVATHEEATAAVADRAVALCGRRTIL